MTTTPGVIYCMSNEDQPGILNLGKTTRPITMREREHSSGQSAPWITMFAVPVLDVHNAETKVFAELDAYRPKKRPGCCRPERLKNAPLLDVVAAFKRVGGDIKERHELLPEPRLPNPNPYIRGVRPRGAAEIARDLYEWTGWLLIDFKHPGKDEDAILREAYKMNTPRRDRTRTKNKKFSPFSWSRTPASELHVSWAKSQGYTPCSDEYWAMIVGEAYEMNQNAGKQP